MQSRTESPVQGSSDQSAAISRRTPKPTYGANPSGSEAGENLSSTKREDWLPHYLFTVTAYALRSLSVDVRTLSSGFPALSAATIGTRRERRYQLLNTSEVGQN